jgi:hypothetical protein
MLARFQLLFGSCLVGLVMEEPRVSYLRFRA